MRRTQCNIDHAKVRHSCESRNPGKHWIPGQARNDKPQRTAGVMHNDTAEIQGGWILATIADTVHLNPPKPAHNALPAQTPVTFVPMPAVDGASGIISKPETRLFSQVRKGYTAFREGDVIIAKITPCMENGKAAVVKDLLNGLGFGSTEFHVLRSNGSVLPEYIYHFVRQESFRKAAEAEMTGSVGQKRVPAEFLKQSEIPLPPLSEQERIVEKVEELLTRVNPAKECLARVSIIMRRFRQAVLAAACSGRLTADWREKNPGVEHFSEFLIRVHIDPTLKKTKYLSIVTTGNRNFPESWNYMQLGAALESLANGIYKPESFYSSSGVACIRMYNIQNGKIVWKDLKRMLLTPEEVEKYSLKPGDLIVNRVNSRELVGKAAIIEEIEHPVVFESKNIRIRFVEKNTLPKFVNFCFMTRMVRDELETNAKQTVGMATISQPQVSGIALPFPPLEEQHEIVRRVELIFKLADGVEKRITAATMRAEKLTQAILAKAFRGELVPTEAELARREGRSYESASELLSRIKSERESKQASQKMRRKESRGRSQII